jgi:hypothetical protein
LIIRTIFLGALHTFINSCSLNNAQITIFEFAMFLGGTLTDIFLN